MNKQEPVVTGNAQLLLGYLAGSLVGSPTYQTTQWDADAGVMEVKNIHTGNVFHVRVVQTEGVE